MAKCNPGERRSSSSGYYWSINGRICRTSIRGIVSGKTKRICVYRFSTATKGIHDLLGFRSLCDNYEDVLQLKGISELRIANMSKGKANDDGYRGIHVYFQLDGSYYPIEIQYNTYYDRQFNNWLHKYVF